MILNIPLFITVAADKSLRMKKELIPIAGLALADSLCGWGYMTAGMWRTSVLLAEIHPNLLARNLDCFLNPFNSVWTFANPLQPFMFVCLSFDRLFSVSFPLRYFPLTRKYSLNLVGVFYSACFLFSTICLLITYTTAEAYIRQYYWTCNSSWVFVPYIANLFENVQSALAIISVVMYIVLLVVYWLRNKFNPTVGHDEKVKRQKKITITLGISSLLTLVFYILPTYSGVIMLSWGVDPDAFMTVDMMMSIMLNINALAQPLLVLANLKDLRKGMKRVICRSTTEVSPATRTSTRGTTHH